MPTSYEFHINKVIFARAWGVLDYDAVIEPIRSLFDDDRYGPGYRFLVDFREVDSFDLDASDFVRIIDEVGASDHALSPSTTAVVVSDDVVYGMMRMYEQLSAELPARLSVFRDFDTAKNWLCD